MTKNAREQDVPCPRAAKGETFADATHCPTTGSVVGGITGEIRWRWAYFAKALVDERFCGQGAGSRLAAAAEAYARSHGCIGVHLSTFQYQSRPFCEKLGYGLFGTLEGYPPGDCQFHLSKRLSEPA